MSKGTNQAIYTASVRCIDKKSFSEPQSGRRAGTIYLEFASEEASRETRHFVSSYGFVSRSFELPSSQDPMSVRCHDLRSLEFAVRKKLLFGRFEKPLVAKDDGKPQIEIANPISLSHNTITTRPSKDCR